MTIAYRNEEMLRMVDADAATVDRRIFADQDIYELELERIFARAWNFMAHDSQIPNSGDFFMTFIGEDRVIVVRDNDSNPQVLVNTCRHRGNAICRADEGHATSFMCTYHGWTYDLKGALVGVPGFKEVYHEELDRESWGLIKAGQVDTYKGFIFATMDAEAPNLQEFLGEVGRLGVSYLAERGDLQCVSGIQKYTIPCNWKLAVDNLFDWYHVGITHSSALMSGMMGSGPGRPVSVVDGLTREHFVMLGDYGHAVGGPKFTPEYEERMKTRDMDESWRERPEVIRGMGSVALKSIGHPSIFPNLWITEGNQMSLRLPKGPHSTEIWWFTLIEKDLEPERFKQVLGRANHVFGPAGMLEMEDGENWGESTRGAMGVVSKRFPLHYAMNLGHGEILEEEGAPPHIEGVVNEHGQFWTYRAWADWMAAESWADLKANHTPSPEGYA